MFRGIPGSFDKAIEGIRNAKAAGIKVGLRMTINKRNWQDINAIFDVMEDEEIPRACFYHLVYAGRGSELMKEDLDHEETRKAVRLIMDRTKAMFDKGLQPEVLTVDNHADGPLRLHGDAEGGPGACRGGPAAPAVEPGQLDRQRHRLRQLERRGLRRPVLAPLLVRQRARSVRSRRSGPTCPATPSSPS